MTPKQLLTIFDHDYRTNNDGIPAPINGSKDGPLAAKLIKRGYTDEQLTRWSQLFFIIPDQFIKRTGYTFGIFYSQIGLVIQYDRRVSKVSTPTPHVSEGAKEIARQMRESNALAAQDFADEYYRSRPWLTRPTSHR